MADMYVKAKMIESYLVKTRRELHFNAELGFKEYKTSKIIQRELKNMGIPYRVIGTGVVGLIKGKVKGNFPSFLVVWMVLHDLCSYLYYIHISKYLLKNVTIFHFIKVIPMFTHT